jgi:hypothetical protein
MSELDNSSRRMEALWQGIRAQVASPLSACIADPDHIPRLVDLVLEVSRRIEDPAMLRARHMSIVEALHPETSESMRPTTTDMRTGQAAALSGDVTEVIQKLTIWVQTPSWKAASDC